MVELPYVASKRNDDSIRFINGFRGFQRIHVHFYFNSITKFTQFVKRMGCENLRRLYNLCEFYSKYNDQNTSEVRINTRLYVIGFAKYSIFFTIHHRAHCACARDQLLVKTGSERHLYEMSLPFWNGNSHYACSVYI